jgi:hypothetical protein
MKPSEISVSQFRFGITNGARQPTTNTRISIYIPKALLKKVQENMRQDEVRSGTIARLILEGLKNGKTKNHKD